MKDNEGFGPKPYAKSMSKAPAPMKTAAHIGRGAPGRFGGADQNKGRTADIAQPSSHAEFEALGRGDDGE